MPNQTSTNATGIEMVISPMGDLSLATLDTHTHTHTHTGIHLVWTESQINLHYAGKDLIEDRRPG